MSVYPKKIKRQNTQDVLSLTPVQKGMLFHYIEAQTNSYYFEQLTLRLRGRINLDLMKKAWQHVILGNEMLRTIFQWKNLDQPVQIVLKKQVLPVKSFDLSKITALEADKRVDQIIEDDQKEKIDLATKPFKITLIKINDLQAAMIINYHHILYDGWSNGIILKEFFDAYHALINDLHLTMTKKNSFKEFVKWLQFKDQSMQREYWSNYLAGFTTKTLLPFSYRQETKIAQSKCQQFSLSQEIITSLNFLIAENRITIATVFYAAWGILLQRYNNVNDVVFGITVSGRNAPIQGVDEMVGLFINTIPLRVKTTADDMILSILQKINQNLQQNIEYESTSMMDLKTCSTIDSHESLFDSIIVVENYPLAREDTDKKMDSKLSPILC